MDIKNSTDPSIQFRIAETCVAIGCALLGLIIRTSCYATKSTQTMVMGI